MKSKKVICINNFIDCQGIHRLSINKEYTGKRQNNLMFIKDEQRPLGLFPSHLFKEVKQYREKRLRDIL